MLNFCDFIQVYVFSTNHHLKHGIKCRIYPTLGIATKHDLIVIYILKLTDNFSIQAHTE